MSLNGFHYATWILAPVLQGIILILMLRQGSWRDYRFFFCYTLLHTIEVPVLFYVYHRLLEHYFVAYWSFVAASILLGFAVIREIFSKAFEPFPGLKDLATTLYQWIVLVMVFVSIIIAEVAPQADTHWVVSWVYSLDRLLRLIQCALLIFLFLFCSRLGLSWRSRVSGIGFGLGIYAAAELLLITLRAQIGDGSDSTISLAKSTVYNVAILSWLVSFARPEPPRRHVPLPEPDRWDYALLTLLHTPKPFIPSVEETVDRVISSHHTSPAGGHV
jgi:hypothetical protein